MFVVEIKRIDKLNEAEVIISLDLQAIEDLITQLKMLKSVGDDAHFFTEEWGGSPLSSQPTLNESVLVNHLKLVRL